MTKRILLIVVLTMAWATYAWSTEKTKAMDFASAHDGNIVIDLPGLDHALRGGADPNWLDPERKAIRSTLEHFVMMACSYSRDPQTDAVGLQAIKALIAAGAKLQPVDQDILFWPVSSGKTDIAALLLEMGADPAAWRNEAIGTPYSPVQYATMKGYHSVVDLLIARGAARPNARDAIQWRFVEAAKYGSLELLDELLKKGANVNEPSLTNEVALINAVDGGFGECDATLKVLHLLKSGADPNRSGRAMVGITTPLHSAVYVTSFTYVRKEDPLCGERLLSALINSGAHISSRDSTGQTPLHIAAERNHLFAARLLYKAGAKVMPRDNAGKTPLDLAESGDMIKLLKSYGAVER